MDDVYLKTPDVSQDTIIGYNVGVRPCRKLGIRLEPQYQDSQLIIHNYGYGGAGLTLCWGGAEVVVKLLQQAQQSDKKFKKIRDVAVLGAGVIGLTTALTLLKLGYRVAIYAAGFSPQLTSNVAAGLIGPTKVSFDVTTTSKVLLNELWQTSVQRFLDNIYSEKPTFAGLQLYKDYIVNVDEQNTSHYHRFPVYPAPLKRVTIHFDNGVVKEGLEKQELGLDTRIFIDDLYRQVQANGAIFYRHYFNNPKEISALAEPVVINCTSLGSRRLFNDKDFIPIRGQLVYLKKQPGMDYAFFQNVPKTPHYWVHIYPWQDRTVLGGVFEYDIDENKIDEYVIEQLLLHAQTCFGAPSHVK